jgi:predicted Zn-dependent peptidase
MDEKRTAIGNSFVLNFDSIDEIAVRNARLTLLNYPKDYDQTYLAKIGEVTAEGVREVAQKRWDPSKFVIVVVGNSAAYANLQKAMGTAKSGVGRFGLNKLRFESAILEP